MTVLHSDPHQALEVSSICSAFQDDLGIGSLGVSVTTMEDVFLKVGELGRHPVNGARLNGLANGTHDHGQRNGVAGSPATANGLRRTADASMTPAPKSSFPEYKRLTGFWLHFNHFRALLAKRHHTAKRQWWLPMFTMLLPIVMTSVYCLVDGQVAERLDIGEVSPSRGGS